LIAFTKAGVACTAALQVPTTAAYINIVALCTGIYKADIGLRGGLIAGIGKAGNPDAMHGVSTGMIIGVNTEVLLLTPSLLLLALSDCALLQHAQFATACTVAVYALIAFHSES
jgi:urease alpha subunit